MTSYSNRSRRRSIPRSSVFTAWSLADWAAKSIPRETTPLMPWSSTTAWLSESTTLSSCETASPSFSSRDKLG